jgi:hypothetical protein
MLGLVVCDCVIANVLLKMQAAGMLAAPAAAAAAAAAQLARVWPASNWQCWFQELETDVYSLCVLCRGSRSSAAASHWRYCGGGAGDLTQ